MTGKKARNETSKFSRCPGKYTKVPCETKKNAICIASSSENYTNSKQTLLDTCF